MYTAMTALALTAIAAAPAAALTQRFEDAREQVLNNKLTERFEEEPEEVFQNKLTQRFEEEREEVLNN
jgi:hypothetical protein